MKTISGHEAIARMKQLKNEPDAHFEFHHLTWDERKQTSKGLRVVSRARLRKALPDEVYTLDSELYLPYTDLDLLEPRNCFRILIRKVAFPPDYELMLVDHFNNKS